MKASNTRNQFTVLIIGDIIVLALFLLIGEIQHAMFVAYNPIIRTLMQAAMVAPPVILLSWLLGVYAHPPMNSWRDIALFLLRSAVAWVLAVPLGLVIRAWGLQSPTIVIPFVNAAFGFGGLMLLIWRGAYAVIALAKHRRHAATTMRVAGK